ncbi:LysR family transcriptional regulator [Thioclava sp. FR2]|uniref:LysR family transcriptional regulator n=1 Tax=Thioclava sp. FR2 TaxID=3445780 RepID=UPI003EBCED90
MQTEWIDTFLDLIESRSFNRTADRMGITQSTVSARVKALEDAVGARLFHRSRAGTEPTTEALRLAPHARILRQEWTLARRSVEKRGAVALTLRISIQNDLAHAQLGPLVGDLRKLLPQTAFYIEPDYSTQMCTDLTTGAQDFGVMFSPKAQAGLYFESVGVIPYRLISTHAQRLEEVEAERYVMAHFSPAFETAHRAALPDLSAAPVSAGQSSAVESLLREMGGSGYVMEPRAKTMVETGVFRWVTDAPILEQPVYAAMHERNRTQRAFRQMVQLVRKRLSA